MKELVTRIRKMGKADTKLNMLSAPGWLTGHMLVATPGMLDPRFARTVIYICSHGPSGAMGLVINRLFHDADFPMLLGQLNIDIDLEPLAVPVQFGGPVETGRGFVLHSTDYLRQETTRIDDNIAITATVEIVEDIAKGRGPDRMLMLLGYAGWSEGQLEEELKSNGWLTVSADEDLLFDSDLETKWDRAMAKLGITPAMLSNAQGTA